MPDISFDPFADGDAITAAEMQARFTALQAQLADLPNYAPAEKAFRKEHLPSLIPVDATLAMTDYSKTNGGTLTPAFTNTYPGWLSDGYAGTGPGAGPGWRGIHSSAQILFPAHVLDMAVAPRIAAYKCLANIEMQKLYETTFTSSNNWTALFVWTVEIAGKWYIVPGTERCVAQQNEPGRLSGGWQRMDIPLRTTIVAADAYGANIPITGIQVAVCVYSQGVVPPGTLTVVLSKWSVTAIPIHAGL